MLKDSKGDSFLIAYKGILDHTFYSSFFTSVQYINGRNGMFVIYQLDMNNKGEIRDIVDTNYYKNHYTVQKDNSYVDTSIYYFGRIWTTIKYFEAMNGKKKLFLLDINGGSMRILNMQDDGGFQKQLTASEPLKSYIFKIYTSPLKNAGTDAEVSITLNGEKGEKYTYVIDTICNDHEKGLLTIDSAIVDNYLDEIKSIDVSHNGKGNNSGWHVQHIIIKESATNNEYHFPINKWIYSSDKEQFFPKDIAIYEMDLQTGDINNARTDANISIKLYNQGSYIQLDNEHKRFEKGKTDRFKIFHEDFGEIKNIYVKHDNTGKKPGWYLEKISIQKYTNKTSLSGIFDHEATFDKEVKKWLTSENNNEWSGLMIKKP